MNHIQRFGLAGILLTALSWPGSADAQSETTAANKLAAQALFDQAQQLADKQEWRKACPQFFKSMQLDRAVGTQLNLARCYANIGKTASAWLHYSEGAAAAKAAGQLERAEQAKLLAEELVASLSKLSIRVEGNTEGLEILRAGEKVPVAAWGTMVAVDPGEFQIVAKAPDKVTFRKKVTVGPDGDQVEVVVPALEDAAPMLTAQDAAMLDGREPDAPQDDPSADESGMSTQMVLGITAGAIGLVGVGIGSAFAFIAKSKYDESLENCLEADANQCTDPGIAAREDAQSAAGVATGLFVAGGLVLATGLTLMITAPSDDAEDTAIRIDALPIIGGTAGPNGMVFRGSW